MDEEIKKKDKEISKNVKEGVSDYFKPAGTDWGSKIKGMLGMSDPLEEAIERRKRKYAGNQ